MAFDTDIKVEITEETPIEIKLLETGPAGAPGTGDMNKSVYDPTNVSDDAFAMDNMAEGTDAKVMTAAERTKLSGIESGAQVNTIDAGDGLAALDSTAATKLGTIATGAEVNTIEAGDGLAALDSAAATKLSGIETAADVTDAGNVGSSINGATAKTTPVDADTMALTDSAASNVLKKVTWANVKATLKTYFDSLTTTLTNKRITPRVGTTTSSATPTINTDSYDAYIITAQTANITSFTTNLSGTPTNGQKLWISITGTAARTIAWGASFEASTIALPTTTVTTARLDVGFVWNAATSKWRCVGVA